MSDKIKLLTVCVFYVIVAALTAGCGHGVDPINAAKPSAMSPATRDAMHRDMLGPAAGSAPASTNTR